MIGMNKEKGIKTEVVISAAPEESINLNVCRDKAPEIEVLEGLFFQEENLENNMGRDGTRSQKNMKGYDPRLFIWSTAVDSFGCACGGDKLNTKITFYFWS